MAKVRKNISIEKEIDDKIKVLSEKTGITMSKIIEMSFLSFSSSICFSGSVNLKV